jgi:hypothetical protein
MRAAERTTQVVFMVGMRCPRVLFFYKNNFVVFALPAQAGIGSIKSHKEMNVTKVWRV